MLKNTKKKIEQHVWLNGYFSHATIAMKFIKEIENEKVNNENKKKRKKLIKILDDLFEI